MGVNFYDVSFIMYQTIDKIKDPNYDTKVYTKEEFPLWEKYIFRSKIDHQIQPRIIFVLHMLDGTMVYNYTDDNSFTYLPESSSLVKGISIIPEDKIKEFSGKRIRQDFYRDIKETHYSDKNNYVTHQPLLLNHEFSNSYNDKELMPELFRYHTIFNSGFIKFFTKDYHSLKYIRKDDECYKVDYWSKGSLENFHTLMAFRKFLVIPILFICFNQTFFYIETLQFLFLLLFIPYLLYFFMELFLGRNFPVLELWRYKQLIRFPNQRFFCFKPNPLVDFNKVKIKKVVHNKSSGKSTYFYELYINASDIGAKRDLKYLIKNKGVVNMIFSYMDQTAILPSGKAFDPYIEKDIERIKLDNNQIRNFCYKDYVFDFVGNK